MSTSSPLATRPKAKVNSSAIRRAPSSNTSQPESPVHTNRPSSPAKFSTTPRIRDGALSPPASTVGVGTRAQAKPTVVRVKPSKSVSSATSSTSKPKSPSPEPRNRALTASSDTLRTQPDSRKHQGSVSAILHHAASYSTLQPPSPSSSPSPLIRTGPLRAAQSELGVPSSEMRNDENAGIAAPQPIKIRSKVTVIAKNINETSPFSDPPAPPMTPTTTNAASRPVTTRVRAGSVSSNVSFTNTTNNPTSPPPPIQSCLAYPITTATPAANPHRYATTRGSPAGGLRSSFSSSSPKYNPTPQEEFRPFAKTSIFPSSPSANANISTNGYSSAGIGVVGLGGPARVMVDPANIPLPPQSPPISSLSISSRSSVSASASRSSVSYVHEPGTSPDSSVSTNLNRKQRGDGSPQSLRNTLDSLVAYASARDDDISFEEGSSGMTADEDEERKVKAEAKSNRKV